MAVACSDTDTVTVTVNRSDWALSRQSVASLADVSFGVQAHCCFTSTEIIRTVRDEEPRTATSTFTETAPELR